MTDDEGPKYKDGDIVWVKLGPCWWPGEVTENAPEDFTSKKPPLAIVKFFNEATYEFVKTPNQIYNYNCERKNEFIKKGMDSFRANNPHMEKFPGDVSLAEIRTDGNPNILADPIFAPQKRSNIIAEVFGSPAPKKTPKEGKHARGRSSKNSGKKPKLNITHRRFLGCDDYEAHIRVQFPGKDVENSSGDEEIVKLNAEPNKTFNCSSCNFQTNRIDVMLFHVKCHIKGIASPMPVKKKTVPKKKKSKIIKHITSDDDHTNSSSAFLDTDSEEEKPKPKRRRRVTSPKKKPKRNEEPTIDIRTNLLAEWSDSENEEVETSKEKNEDEENNKNEEKEHKSCFDFDDEEEETLGETTAGRKIPRVIPPKSSEIEEETEETTKSSDEFKDLMESTSVPDLPDVPPEVKPQNNIKTEVATKLTNPKKRFVKSFEDFELLQNEQRKAQEEEEKKGKVVVEAVEPPPEHKTAESEKEEEEEEKIEPKEEKIEPKEDKIESNLQISKLKCQIMSKLGDEEPEVSKTKKSHRSPRSKILESYRKDKRKSVEEVKKDEEEDVVKQVEELPIEEKEMKKLDEEIEKINPIDDYLNDFLFDLQKKEESPKNDKIEEEKEEESAPNEVRIKSDSGDIDIAIKTNLSNFNKGEEEMSALSTLAMVSQLEEEKPIEEENEEIKLPFVEKPETEMVPIDGNLTKVSEKDLADSQVEITATCKKPVTLTNFSMDFSECNSNSNNSETSEVSETKTEETKKNDDLMDLEEHIPSQIVDKKTKDDEDKEEDNPPSKLLERLTEKPKTIKVPKDSTKVTKKFIIKSPTSKIIKPVTTSNKPVILSEKIIKPITPTTASVSVQKVTSKRNLHDPDEIDAFIIQKGNKTEEEEEEEENEEIPVKKLKKNTTGMDLKKLQVSSTATSVKKRGKAKILQQTIITPAGEIIQPGVPTSDDNVFDINSMPIVLSDQILTPESIENMPIYLSEAPAEQPKIVKKAIPSQMRVINKSISSSGTKLIKTPKILGTMGTKLIKQNSFSPKQKFVIVTQPTATATTSKYTVGKKQIVKSAGTLTKVQNIAPEPSGNKIMILTDQQGQQQRVLLTPAQQKMMGYQNQGTKIKTVMKGNIIQKAKDGSMPGSSGLITKTITPSRVLTQLKKPIGRKIQMQSQKVPIKPPPLQQKTILIKNQHGQTVRKIQGTDDALLDKQVAEQIEAIKASGVLQQKQEILNYKNKTSTVRRSYVKKIDSPKKTEPVPPLAPISPKKPEVEKQQEGKSLHQLVIQDAMGNQTTITEGQILALPSETIDGQPQSYMLVTLDESGNLTPLNNEALLSLDPNLGLGGDLGNTVLQIDQSEGITTTTTAATTTTTQSEVKSEEVVAPPVTKEEEKPDGQQLIVTGDPIAAQKFLESLTEGNTDLANILANAEGSILIHADGQQILINTDSDNQMLLSVNTDNLNMAESSEGGGNPIFATQPSKNQDILAAALADTDVFQGEQNNGQKVSQLSPNSSLYPINVGNVLETSLTLNSPIMTPLEVPSTNSKKIDESDILAPVPKTVDLPITITDPNISQTVSQQQVSLPSNIELSLPISESAIVTCSEMSYYSLPSLESDRSMPILTEDEPKDDEKGGNDESEGLCTLGGEMCSSLSEPPPDMFDLSAVLSSQKEKDESNPGSVTETSSPNTVNEDSCEIPVQPEIVTKLEGEEKEANSTEV
ncbi:titin-like [Tribolium madens]|uniref:titin-like n=1 Tax=Tribolium madens TaxID=41895 RepID=UPI001CF73008|nr:titin-like [Tribolium madens]